MKKYSIFTLAIGLATSLAFTSCGDASDEITSIDFGRIMSPINPNASNVGETSVDLKWALTAGATSYNLQLFADDSLSYKMEGTPAKVISNISPDQLPITVDGLFFDTKYTAYIQAINANNESISSKWNGIYFRTGAKQFLKNPKPAEIADRSVTLTWEVEEGYDVSTIVIGSITHEITAEEKAAGQATIEGLEPETTYTAYLYYNGKQCGNRNFTTIADLAGAILVHEGDDLKAVIEEAEEGAVLAIYGGTYNLNAKYDEATGDLISTGAVKVYKTITIKGIYPTDQPKIKGRFEIYDGAGLSVNQCKIDGSMNKDSDGNDDTSQIFNYKFDAGDKGSVFEALDIQNCEITGYAAGKGLVYLNIAAVVKSITVKNSIIYGIECSGGDFIDSRLGLPREVTLSNSTFYNVAKGRDFIRIDDKSGDFPSENGPVVTVDHCTLYNIGANASNNRIFYVRFAGNKATYTNNVTVGTKYKRGFANGTAIDLEPTLQNNFYFDCENLTSAGSTADAAISWFDTEGTIESSNPFADPDNGDFTLNANSKAYAAKAGDSRWIQ